MKNIMCKAEARHIVQFIMGIALDLFSYNAPATTCIEEEEEKKTESNHWEFNCLANS